MTMEHGTTLWDAPDPTDAPATVGGLGTRPASPARFRGMRRGIATALLAAGLLVVGGVAAVSAADPSASPAPNATEQPSDPGTSGQPADPGARGSHQRGDCPNDDSGSGNGSDSGGSDSSPDASPDSSGL